MPTRATKVERVVIRGGARRKRHAQERHGGWKVAYADFVTAMMAFFLLMWLVSTTTKGQRDGISDYFKRSDAPASVLIMSTSRLRARRGLW